MQHGDFSTSSGIVGMGRGPLSLVSQIGSSFGNIFSYCLGSMYNASEVTPLFLGKAPTFGAAYSVTPLIQNHLHQTFYYLGLDGISVAGKPVHIPKDTFEILANGSGGLIIDSGTTVTILEEAGYRPFLDAVSASITAQPLLNSSATVGLDLCYIFTPGLLFPNITFHFAGGADYVLPPENSFISDQQDTGGLVCLAFTTFKKAPFSVFGNFQQQSFHIVYDVGKNELSFSLANCDAM